MREDYQDFSTKTKTFLGKEGHDKEDHKGRMEKCPKLSKKKKIDEEENNEIPVVYIIVGGTFCD